MAKRKPSAGSKKSAAGRKTSPARKAGTPRKTTRPTAAAREHEPAQGELSFGAPRRGDDPAASASAGDRDASGRPAGPAGSAGSADAASAAAAASKPVSAGSGPAAVGARGPGRPPSFRAVARKIRSEAGLIQQNILLGKKPCMRFPLRSLNNVTYDPRTGYFKLKGKRKERTLTVSTVKTFAQTLKMMALAKELVETDDIATKREAYYVSKNWADARFQEQPESDTVMEDVEAFFAVNREQLGFVPEEKGGDVAGQLVVIDKDQETGDPLHIDCTKFGSGAYSVPISVEELGFETDAQFILCIETAGMFQRLVKHKYWQRANCILVSMGGVPTRACRRFVRRLADAKGLPVYVFVDGDPYGYSNIYRTLKVGSGNAAHLNEFFCVPQAHLLGITPQDIVEYELPSHPLKEVDIKRARDALKNDPFILHYRSWQKALEQMIKMGVRAEQQALAKHGLNYVIEEYLPRKLANVGAFLP